MNRTVLVAGATGRVGTAAVRHFLHAGFGVRALVRSAADKGESLRSSGAEVVVGDVTESDSLAPAIEGCSGVYAALAAGPGRGSAEEVEYQGNLNLLAAAQDAGVLRFVYSSALLVDHPLAQRVSAFREKLRFEEVMLGAEGVTATVLPSDVHGDPPHGAPGVGSLCAGPPATPYGVDRRLRRIARRRAHFRE